MNRLALFDCDGTLVDSQHVICNCMDEAFARSGLTAPDRGDTRRIVGLSLLHAVRKLLPACEGALHRQIAEDYKTAFQNLRALGGVQEPLYEGIIEAIDAFEAAGWQLGVATGKSDRGLDLCLHGHKLRDRFITLQTADRHPSKPHPSMVYQAMIDANATPATTVIIGDTSFDMLMARSAKASALGVSWGYHATPELEASGAMAVASSAYDLEPLAARLVSQGVRA